jgi:hypothetical protein
MNFNANYSNLENYAFDADYSNLENYAFDADYSNLENYAFDADYSNLENYACGLPTKLQDSQLTRLHQYSASTKSSTFVRLASSQLKINVGRRGTNQLRLLERYLDVLVKHTTKIPPPTALVEETAPSALVEGVSLR